MSVASFIRDCLARGMDLETALVASEVHEASAKQSAGKRQERNRRYYAGKKTATEPSETVLKRLKASETSYSDTPSFLPSLSPTPPILTNQSPPPIVPPAEPKPAVAASATDDGFEPAWKALPDQMRKRCIGKDQTRKLWRSAAQRVGGSAPLFAALKRYLANDSDCRRTGGPGFHIWLKDCRYEAWLPEPDTPQAQGPPAPEVVAYRLRHYRDTREWRPEWGERPSEAA